VVPLGSRVESRGAGQALSRDTKTTTAPVIDLQAHEPAWVALGAGVRTPSEGQRTACSRTESGLDGVGWNRREVGSLGGIPTVVPSAARPFNRGKQAVSGTRSLAALEATSHYPS